MQRSAARKTPPENMNDSATYFLQQNFNELLSKFFYNLPSEGQKQKNNNFGYWKLNLDNFNANLLVPGSVNIALISKVY